MATTTKKCSCPGQRRCRHGRVVRYRANGKQHEKSFPHDRKTVANDYAGQVEHEKRSGDYIDPRAGDVTFQVYAERWISQHHGAENIKVTYRRAGKHITPASGGVGKPFGADHHGFANGHVEIGDLNSSNLERRPRRRTRDVTFSAVG